jgi:hypothetical protein
MTQREKVLNGQMADLDAKTAVLSEKTAALAATIAELRQLPATLGSHTSHYIGEGVRKAIQVDFTKPIADAVSGPMAQLDYSARQAREAIAEVRRESKLQNWTWVAIMIILGIALGVTGSYFFYTRDVGRINDRIDSLQQQIAPPAPIVDAKPLEGKVGKGKKGH